MSNPNPTVRGRFAPSPTGRMHLGNIYAALVSWLMVKSKGGLWVLRHEDLDPQRSRRDYALQIEDDLTWLGLNWDEGGLDNVSPAAGGSLPYASPYSQSLRGDVYREMLSALCQTGMVYPCKCTRSEIMASRAPHQSDGRIVYGGNCRPAILPQPGNTYQYLEQTRRENSWRTLRLAVPDREIPFTDLICGKMQFNLARECGDMVLQRADGAWAYQLAVVADDHFMGITQVARGNDLLLSTSQQKYLYEIMGWNSPEFGHFPLLVNSAGQRLSKRDGALSMEQLRKRFTPEELLGRLAEACGLADNGKPTTPEKILEKFSIFKFKGIRTITINEKFFL